jgi:hypothetical protein
VQTRRMFLGWSLLVLGGCGTLPAGGPSSWDVWAWRENQNLPYAFVPVSAEVWPSWRKLSQGLPQRLPIDGRRARSVLGRAFHPLRIRGSSWQLHYHS